MPENNIYHLIAQYPSVMEIWRNQHMHFMTRL